MTGSAMRVCKDNKCQVKCAKDTDCDPFYKCDMRHGRVRLFRLLHHAGVHLQDGQSSGHLHRQAVRRALPVRSGVRCHPRPMFNGQAVTAVMAGLQVCLSAHCVDVGCDSNDQCRILSHLPGGSKTTAECRPVPTP